MKQSPDNISRDVLQHELMGIAEEMSTALRRAAFSSIIWDMYDYACGLFTPTGEMLAQARTIPAQLGIMSTAISHMLTAIPLSEWRAGDVIACNDPYRGCTHTPDIVLFTPVMLDGDVVAIASTIAHHIDVGGRVPGTEAADSVEVFGEGLILPPLKLMEGGVANRTVFDIIAANVRDPAACHGDLRAQIAGCRTGERRLAALVLRYGRSRFHGLAQACLDYTETYLRRTLASVGNGSARARVLIEDDVTGSEPICIAVHARIDSGELFVSFDGSSAQRDNALNCPVSSTVSMVHFAVKAVLAPDLPANEGCNRPVHIRIPMASIVNPERPHAVSVRHLTQQAVADAVLRALASLHPSSAAAGCQISFPTFCAGGLDDRPERIARAAGRAPYYVIADILGGGTGGGPRGDGMNAIDTHGGNCAILSAEVMEEMSPLRVRRSELIPDSGGAGQFRGGLAIRRDYEVLSSSTVMSGYLQQTRPDTAPWGFEGGAPGACARWLLDPGGNDERGLPSKVVAHRLQRGEVLRLESAGGGGWGVPDTRDRQARRRDLELGYISGHG